MSNELVQQNKPTIGNKFGLAKRVAEAQTRTEQGVSGANALPNRLGLIMDDSGSMAGSMNNVHLAIDTFIKNCNASDTALCLYPLNAEAKALTNIFASIGIYASTINATGGTPLYTKLQEMLSKENITRAVAFSDGSPTDNFRSYNYESNVEEQPKDKHTETVKMYVDKKVPVDTIFIGEFGSSGYITMKRIADETGGIFLHFTDASVLAKSLKYLTPHYRALLMDSANKGKGGEGSVMRIEVHGIINENAFTQIDTAKNHLIERGIRMWDSLELTVVLPPRETFSDGTPVEVYEKFEGEYVNRTTT